jgi:cytochrome c-type biogenesis protein CcmH
VRRVTVLLALFATLALPVPAAIAAEPQTSLPDIEDEVMCIVCGVPLELATEAPQANQERDLIRRLIAQGLTKEEIKDQLVDQYGPTVLAVPDDEGFDLMAWLVPGAAMVAAGVAIAFGLRRWRRADAAESSSEPGEEVDPADAERLDADIARYEL